ncbi:MAG: biopolymer transporter ExbD, partial [Kofleriaceae bacterium]
MGMSTGGGKSGSVQSEINVTPLIDVLLVLLIIFLVLIPVMMKMQKLDVPRKITESESYDPNASMLTVKVMPDLSLVFNDGTNETAIPSADLGKML